MKHARSVALGGLALVMFAGAASAASITRIGTLGGLDSNAWAINNKGQVVGQSTLEGDTVAHAYIWSKGQITDLGALSPELNSAAYGINDLGDVVGESGQVGSGAKAAMLWSGGGHTNLNPLLGASNALAWDINENGVVVGQGNILPGFSKGWVWSAKDGGQPIGVIPGYMGGANLGINNDGVAVGHSFFFGDADKAHVLIPDHDGNYTQPGEQIGPGLQAFSIAQDVNNNGMMVGYANNPSGPWHACIFTGDTNDPIIDLGTLPGYAESEAHGVNDDGVIVGFAFPIDFEDPVHAFAYFNGQMVDLNDYLGEGSDFAVLLEARDVNNRGDIVGTGLTVDGRLAGFVLSGVVPAPGATGVLALAGALALRRRRA